VAGIVGSSGLRPPIGTRGPALKAGPGRTSSTLAAVRLSLVIVTRGRPDALRRTLATLERCTPLPHELIVVDGDAAGSAAPVVAAVAAVPARHILSAPGMTRQRNRGLDEASGDVVVFADDDVDFDPGAFGALAAAYADPAVVGATGRVIEDDPHRVGGAGSPLRRLLGRRARQGTMSRAGLPRRLVDLDAPRAVEFLHGCLMSARRDVAARVRFDDVGLDGYSLAEDEDFGYRLSRAGRVVYVPSARVVHLAQGRRTQDQRAFDRMLVVNRAYLFRKNFDHTAGARAQFAATMALLALHRALNGRWSSLRGVAEGAREAWRRRGEPLPSGRTAADAEELQGQAAGAVARRAG
jgi:GT2 family glycosyltransferase